MNTRNYKLVTLAVLVFLFFNLKATGQVGIGTITPNANAMLDVVSTDKGFLPPRMTTVEKDLISVTLAEAGMLVFDTTLGEYSFWDGTAWVAIGGGTPVAKSIGNMYVNGASSTTLGATGTKLTDATTIINSTDFTATNNRLVYTGVDTKVFEVSVTLSFERDFADLDSQIDIEFFVSKGGNNFEEPGLVTFVRIPELADPFGIDNIYNITITGTISLATNEFVEIWGRSFTNTPIFVADMNVVLTEH